MPLDRVAACASALDPHISVAAATYQAGCVARTALRRRGCRH